MFNYRIILAVLSLAMSVITLDAHANYIPVVISGGYDIQLKSDATISKTPSIGSDGKNYYQVGNPIIINTGSADLNASGEVKCIGYTWGTGSNLNIPWTNAYHRLFVYAPAAGKVSNKAAYRINNNVVMTVESQMSNNWLKKNALLCAEQQNTTGVQNISGFSVHFPMTFTFYVNEVIIDGQLMLPAMDLAGYVRAYTKPATTPPINSLPIEQATAPVRLVPSTINVSSSCSTMTSSGLPGTLNIKHGNLNSVNYDSIVQEKVVYSCNFAKSTRVNMRLDYAKDSDPQGRLPMTNNINGNKIYSDLTLLDDSTGQSGTTLKVDIQDIKSITVKSHIQGENASSGNYSGSAWLIATYD